MAVGDTPMDAEFVDPVLYLYPTYTTRWSNSAAIHVSLAAENMEKLGGLPKRLHVAASRWAPSLLSEVASITSPDTSKAALYSARVESEYLNKQLPIVSLITTVIEFDVKL